MSLSEEAKKFFRRLREDRERFEKFAEIKDNISILVDLSSYPLKDLPHCDLHVDDPPDVPWDDRTERR